MTARIYIRARSTADRLLTKYGRAAAFRRDVATGPSYAPVVTPGDPVPCVLAKTGQDIFHREPLNVQVGDIFGLIKVVPGFAPELTDVLLLDGGTYHFQIIRPLEPADLMILYKFQARR